MGVILYGSAVCLIQMIGSKKHSVGIGVAHRDGAYGLKTYRFSTYIYIYMAHMVAHRGSWE